MGVVVGEQDALAADAIEVCTDGLSPDEVVAKLEEIVRSNQ